MNFKKYISKVGEKMTKEEMIYEIAKCVCSVCEMGRCYGGKCAAGNDCRWCGVSMPAANSIYEIFYRAVNK